MRCIRCAAPIPERDYPAVWPWDAGCACGVRGLRLPCYWCQGEHANVDCPQGPTEKHWKGKDARRKPA